ncbi:hypothetical protein U1Q18_008941 [Sarracenia purpurea var. burkii]
MRPLRRLKMARNAKHLKLLCRRRGAKTRSRSACSVSWPLLATFRRTGPMVMQRRGPVLGGAVAIEGDARRCYGSGLDGVRV